MKKTSKFYLETHPSCSRTNARVNARALRPFRFTFSDETDLK